MIILKAVALSCPEVRGLMTNPEAISLPAAADSEAAKVLKTQKIRLIRYLEPATKRTILTFGGAGIDPEELAQDANSTGVLLGANRGAEATRQKFAAGFKSKGRRMVSATLFAQCGYNMISSILAITYGLKGANLTLSGGADLGTLLICRAIDLLNRGKLKNIIVGSYDLRMSEDSASETILLVLSRQEGPGIRIELEKRESQFEAEECGLYRLSEPGNFSAGDREPFEAGNNQFGSLLQIANAFSDLKLGSTEKSGWLIAANRKSGGCLLKLTKN
ncbi:MAG: hypothetical protein ACI8UO_004778 [Verrucomicrobiales bacterium]|jgi:hypothetical protein